MEGILRDYRFDFFGNIHIDLTCGTIAGAIVVIGELCWNSSGIKHAIFYIKINQKAPWTSLSECKEEKKQPRVFKMTTVFETIQDA